MLGSSGLSGPAPAPIHKQVEPLHGGKYLLYKPSGYDAALAWPLLVVCHSTFPDSAKYQLNHWTELAESRGFIVAAPKLASPARLLPRNADKQLALQQADERRILDIVRHVRGAHRIARDRIFLYGYAGGAPTAMHVGLKHANLFRAVAVLQPRFAVGLMADAQHYLDPYQPVLVDYSINDAITGKRARACVNWLRGRSIYLSEDDAGSARAPDVRRTVEFFEEVLRSHAWLHIRAFPPESDNAMASGFRVTGSYEPVRYRWEFGDGDESPVAEPTHVYAKPGTYRVTVHLAGPQKQTDCRTVYVEVPNARIKRYRIKPDAPIRNSR